MLRDPSYMDAAIYTLMGYFLSWQPSEIDRMEYATLVKCLEVMAAVLEQGIAKYSVRDWSRGVKL